MKLALAQLLAAPGPAAPRAAEVARAAKPALSGVPFNDSYLFQEIARLRPRDSLVVEEAPSSRDAMHDYMPVLAPDSFFTCASTGM